MVAITASLLNPPCLVAESLGRRLFTIVLLAPTQRSRVARRLAGRKHKRWIPGLGHDRRVQGPPGSQRQTRRCRLGPAYTPATGAKRGMTKGRVRPERRLMEPGSIRRIATAARAACHDGSGHLARRLTGAPSHVRARGAELPVLSLMSRRPGALVHHGDPPRGRVRVTVQPWLLSTACRMISPGPLSVTTAVTSASRHLSAMTIRPDLCGGSTTAGRASWHAPDRCRRLLRCHHHLQRNT